MRGWIQQTQSVLGAATCCIGLAGCAAQQGDSLRLSEELGRARADAAWQQARAAGFESRMSQLEQRAAAAQSAQSMQSAQDRALSRRLDRLLELNERLLAERGAAPVATPTPTAARAEPTLTQEQELRALVERMRGRAGSPHGGLTREQEDALRVLTRPERKLDMDNPWLPAFY